MTAIHNTILPECQGHPAAQIHRQLSLPDVPGGGCAEAPEADQAPTNKQHPGKPATQEVDKGESVWLKAMSKGTVA